MDCPDYNQVKYKVDWGDNGYARARGKNYWETGAALVSSLGTLYIMQCTTEYRIARYWVQSSFNPTTDLQVGLSKNYI